MKLFSPLRTACSKFSRGVVIVLGALALSACVAPGGMPLPTNEATGLRVSSIVVDVSPLKEKGLGSFADLAAASLSSSLNRSFADRMGDKSAPRLVVRLKTVFLSSYVGNGGGDIFDGGSGDTDSIDGEALIVSRSGEIIARYPQLSALPASYSGAAWYDPNLDQKRLAALTQQYAAWVRKTITGQSGSW